MSTADRFGLPLGTCRRCLGPLDESADCHSCERCPRCKDRPCPRCDGDGWVAANGNAKREI